jgi:hypothetical protein
VLEAVFTLLEFPSPSRRIFIGSLSIPPLWFAVSVLHKCPQFVKKMDKGAKKKLNPTIKRSLIYTKPNRKNKTKSNTYVIKKKANGKVVAHKVGKMKEQRGWNQPI